ncbi:MAG: AAA family ATPase [Polyangiaceae bacterium]
MSRPGVVRPAYASDPHFLETWARLDLDDALVAMAWDVARMGLGPRDEATATEDGTDARAVDRDAAFVALVSVLLADKRGHTRVPMGRDSEGNGGSGAAPGDTLEDLVRALGYEGARARERLARIHGAVGRVARGEGASGVVGGPGDRSPLIVDDGSLATERAVHEERFLARLFVERFRDQRDDAARDRALDALRDVAGKPVVTARGPVRANALQTAAAHAAAVSRLVVVSGGPGTGKTSIVVTILRVLARLGYAPTDFALAAPTGKAASRMDESVRGALLALPDPDATDRALSAGLPRAETLHRLLGYRPGLGTFVHHEGNPLSERVVLVDEASMIDSTMMTRLVRAIDGGGRLVLLGDVAQLPSVGAGAVFRDLLAAGSGEGATSPASVTLEESFRMDPSDPSGRHVLETALSVAAGTFETAPAALTRGKPHAVASAEDLAFRGVEHLESAWDRVGPEVLVRWIRHRTDDLAASSGSAEAAFQVFRARGADLDAESDARARRLLAADLRSRILTFTRKTAAGVGETRIGLGAAGRSRIELAALMGGARGDGRVPGLRVADVGPFDPVIVTRNDYARDLTNGDLGIALPVLHDDGLLELAAFFVRGATGRLVPMATLDGVSTLAYALTVHKAQGSEFDRVLVALPGEPLPMATREILYTAMTRSRTSVVVVGPAAVARASADRPSLRHTSLVRRIREAEARLPASNSPA